VKVVLDTNVLVSALVFPGGAPEPVYRLAIEGDWS
jgi:predicted nucleic acid-binding protein